ncbi:MAG: FAD/NAD(P)-binding protein [Halioglobus sp.]
MKKSDIELGMKREITRRDFIHDAALATMGLGLPLNLSAQGMEDASTAYYPPTQTGLRGSHPGSFENAHRLAREGKGFPNPVDLNETYDLVVVGAGISGLAAAHFYRKRYGEDSRILLLENHDDFGGHARRNEFHQGGQMRLALGGVHNLEYWSFSETVSSLLEELGVDVQDMIKHKEFQYGSDGPNGPAIFFDEENYGRNVLVPRCDFTRGKTGAQDASIDSFPMGKEAREQLKRFFAMRTNVLEEMSDDEVEQYVTNTPYYDFLREHGGLGEEALQVFDNANHGNWGVETRSLSVAECVYEGMPGINLLGEDDTSADWDYNPAMWPDGNASLARLQVRALIPSVSPDANADNIALAKFDYGQLDNADAPVRLRLNSTVINITNTEQGVSVSYIKEGKTVRVSAKHGVLACYHSIIPHLCPTMPEAQRNAQKYQVKIPLLLTNVLIRSSESLDKLGITGASCPGRMHSNVFMFKGLNTGGFEHRAADKGPVPLTFWGSISPPKDVVDLKAQFRASRQIMLNLSFEDYEREVRTVLDGMLGPAGFDVQRDILAITVNRWPHGYAYEYMNLWDPEFAEGEAPHELARQPFDNIVVANADSGASAYTHVAIDEAFRAIGELP